MAQQTIPVNDGYISSHVGSTPSTGPFAVDFPFFSLNDVVVSRQPDGTFVPIALTRGVDYDITGVATDDGSFSSGSVTLYIAVSNSIVIRFRTTPVERISNFPLQGFFSRLSLNAELNKITVWMQELNALLGTTSEASQAYAPLASPLFTGDPRAPTPAPADNDTSIATTAFVQAALAGVGAAIPSGVIADFAGSVTPAGWLLCDASTVSRTAFPSLFAAIGTTYNVGGEAGTVFRLPDLRGRVSAGPDAGANRMGGIGATAGGIGSAVLGASGGQQGHILTIAELASHTHPGPSSSNFALANAGTLYSSPAGSGGAYFGYTANTGISGVDNTHNNTQPTLILNKIIKT